MLREATESSFLSYIVDILKAVATPLSVLLTGYFAYKFGMKQYKKQRSIEEFRQVFLTDGIEKLHSEMASVVGSVEICKGHTVWLPYLKSKVVKVGAEDMTFEFKGSVYLPKDLGADVFERATFLTGTNNLVEWAIGVIGDAALFQHVLETSVLWVLKKRLRGDKVPGVSVTPIDPAKEEQLFEKAWQKFFKEGLKSLEYHYEVFKLHGRVLKLLGDMTIELRTLGLDYEMVKSRSRKFETVVDGFVQKLQVLREEIRQKSKVSGFSDMGAAYSVPEHQ